MPEDERPQVVHQAGEKHLPRCGRPFRCRCAGPLRGLHRGHGRGLRWADLVICRAGALTVAELAAAASPACWCPSRMRWTTTRPAMPNSWQRRRCRPAAAIRTDAGARRVDPQLQPRAAAADGRACARAGQTERCRGDRRAGLHGAGEMKHKVSTSTLSASVAPA